MAARGISTRQIAFHLHIAVGTVRSHLSNIYPKMGVVSRGEALCMTLENGWFTISEIEATIDDA